MKGRSSTMLAMDIVRCRYILGSNSGAFGNVRAQISKGEALVQQQVDLRSIFFQMEDGQVLVVGGHDDQGVLDSVELINLTSFEVGG